MPSSVPSRATLPGPLQRWREAYAQASPLGKTWRELGLAYLGYFVLLPLTMLFPQFAMSEDNAAGIDSAFAEALSGGNMWLALGGFVVLLAVLVPIVEESLFRGIPLLLRLGLGRVLPAAWHRTISLVIGVVSAVVFASAHNLVPGTLPLPQLWLGLLAWHAASTRGLRYSMLLHGLNNAVVALVLIGLFLLFGPEVVLDMPAESVPTAPVPAAP